MAELLARLRALQRRSPQFQPQQLQVGSFTLDYGSRKLYCQELNGEQKIIPLTNKEFQLLEYFMRHPNQIVTRDQLLNQLWEWGAEPMSNVVAAQMRLLRRELPTLTYRYSAGFPIHWGLPLYSWIFYVLKTLVLHPLQGQKR